MEINNILHKISAKRKTDLEEIRNQCLHLKSGVKKGETKGEKQETLGQVIRRQREQINIIAEIKPYSPSQGNLLKDEEPLEIVKEYEKGGAIGFSILTEPHFFHGSYDLFAAITSKTDKPRLMKDFIVDPVQIEVAAALGASNILIINEIANLQDLIPLCLKTGVEPLIEIHEERELEDLRVVPMDLLKKCVIGVNNRNLKTLKVNILNSINLIPKILDIHPDLCVISESGINDYNDIYQLRKCGAQGFLIGTSLMKAENRVEKLKQLRGVN